MNERHPDTTDANELGELLQFLTDWLAHDREGLDTSLTGFVGSPAYNAVTLGDDLHRFAFLLGANDGEHLLNPEQP